jgi:hypothetical protein
MKMDNFLKKFLGTDPLRPVFETPHKEGDYVYATNAHILIKCPLRFVEREYQSVKNFPDVERVLGETKRDKSKIFKKEQITLTLSKLTLVDKYEECSECGGDGVYECHCCGQDVECENCNKGLTSRVIGKEYDYDEELAVIDGVHFNPNFLKLIEECCYLLNSDTTFFYSQPNRVIIASIGEVEILLMPMAYIEEEKKKKLHELIS